MAQKHKASAVRLLDYGEEEGLDFIALEYIPGRTLGQVLQDEGPLEVKRGTASPPSPACATLRANRAVGSASNFPAGYWRWQFGVDGVGAPT